MDLIWGFKEKQMGITQRSRPKTAWDLTGVEGLTAKRKEETGQVANGLEVSVDFTLRKEQERESLETVLSRLKEEPRVRVAVKLERKRHSASFSNSDVREPQLRLGIWGSCESRFPRPAAAPPCKRYWTKRVHLPACIRAQKHAQELAAKKVKVYYFRKWRRAHRHRRARAQGPGPQRLLGRGLYGGKSLILVTAGVRVVVRAAVLLIGQCWGGG